ncbi:MAG: GNAT family N-acetyltransferase [Spirochaetales bacterium]|nr:GNAT family N-acetyltransferase [Spirochaetales bacterium]
MNYVRKIPGETVYLSPMRPDDAAQYAQWLNTPEINQFLALSTSTITENGEKAWIEQMGEKTVFAIVRQEDDALLGNVALDTLDILNSTGEAGIFIGDSACHGKGYGTEALALLLGYAFANLNLESVMIRVFPWNPRAQKAYEKVGFQPVGVLRKAVKRYGKSWDVPVFDITAEDFAQGPWKRFLPKPPHQAHSS